MTSLPLSIGPAGGEGVGYGEVIAVLARLACGSWEAACGGCSRKPTSNTTTLRRAEVNTTKTSTEAVEKTFPIVPYTEERDQGSRPEYVMPEITW